MPDQVLAEREHPLGHLAGEDVAGPELVRDAVVLGELGDRHRVDGPVEDVDPVGDVVERAGSRRVRVEPQAEMPGHELDPLGLVDARVLRIHGRDREQWIAGELAGARRRVGGDGRGVDPARERHGVGPGQAPVHRALDVGGELLARLGEGQPRRLEQRLRVPVAAKRGRFPAGDGSGRRSREALDAAEHRPPGVEAPEEHRLHRLDVRLAGDAGAGGDLLPFRRGHEAVQGSRGGTAARARAGRGRRRASSRPSRHPRRRRAGARAPRRPRRRTRPAPRLRGPGRRGRARRRCRASP